MPGNKPKISLKDTWDLVEETPIGFPAGISQEKRVESVGLSRVGIPDENPERILTKIPLGMLNCEEQLLEEFREEGIRR